MLLETAIDLPEIDVFPSKTRKITAKDAKIAPKIGAILCFVWLFYGNFEAKLRFRPLLAVDGFTHHGDSALVNLCGIPALNRAIVRFARLVASTAPPAMTDEKVRG